MDTVTERLKFADIYPDKAGKLAQKLHKKKDDIPLVRKYFVYDKQEGDVSKKDRTVISRISCVDKDRDGESLLPSGVQLENYRKNPIVCWGHSYGDPKHFVGKNIWIKKDDKGLIAKTVFAKSEFADQVFRAYTEDVGDTGPLLRGFSVGFIPLKWDEPTPEKGEDEKDVPRRTYTDWELLEYSCVGIPCSPESLTMAYEKGVVSKNFKEKIEKEITLDEPDEYEQLKEAEKKLEKMTPSERKEMAKKAFGAWKDESDTELVDDIIDSDDLEDKNADIVLKPETTDDYHRIPVSQGHSGHEIRTIDVSKEKKIKALYCVDCKKIITYMFATSDWSMAEAQDWVDEHKEITMEDTKTIITVDGITQEIEGEIEIPEQVEDTEEKKQETFTCECIECDYTLETEKHCKDIKCPKCGGVMRRAERPGPGQEGISESDEAKILEALFLVKGELAELKEGRVLSTANRKLVKDIIDALDGLRENLSKLYEATEPPVRESVSVDEEITVEGDFKSTASHQLPNNFSEIITEAIEKSLTPERIGKILREKVKDEIDRLKGVVR